MDRNKKIDIYFSTLVILIVVIAIVLAQSENIRYSFDQGLPTDKGKTSHLECIDNTCTNVPGSGTNECSNIGNYCGPMYTLADLPAPFVKNGQPNVVVIYGSGDPVYKYGTSVVYGLRGYFGSYVNTNISNDTVGVYNQDYEGNENYALIGSPCYNPKIAQYMGLPYPSCADLSTIPEGKGIIKLIRQESKHILIIAADERSPVYIGLLDKGRKMLDEVTGTSYVYGFEDKYGVISSDAFGNTAKEKCVNNGFEGCVSVEVYEMVTRYPNSYDCTGPIDYVDRYTLTSDCSTSVNVGSAHCGSYNGSSALYESSINSITCYRS